MLPEPLALGPSTAVRHCRSRWRWRALREKLTWRLKLTGADSLLEFSLRSGKWRPDDQDNSRTGDWQPAPMMPSSPRPWLWPASTRTSTYFMSASTPPPWGGNGDLMKWCRYGQWLVERIDEELTERGKW